MLLSSRERLDDFVHMRPVIVLHQDGTRTCYTSISSDSYLRDFILVPNSSTAQRHGGLNPLRTCLLISLLSHYQIGHAEWCYRQLNTHVSHLSHVLTVNLISSMKKMGHQWRQCQLWCSLANANWTARHWAVSTGTTRGCGGITFMESVSHSSAIKIISLMEVFLIPVLLLLCWYPFTALSSCACVISGFLVSPPWSWDIAKWVSGRQRKPCNHTWMFQLRGAGPHWLTIQTFPFGQLSCFFPSIAPVISLIFTKACETDSLSFELQNGQSDIAEA